MQSEIKASASTASGMSQVFIISLGLFVIFLDSTVVNIALPSMIEQLAVTLRTAAWIINAYTMTVAILLIFMGKLADLHGKKRLYAWGLIMFMLSSLLCALAPNAVWLVTARVLQGISGAMAIPASMSLVRSVVPKEKVGAAMGIWSAVGALAIAVGPSLGGGITEVFGWRWVFYINIPVILCALFLLKSGFTSYQDQMQPGKLDWLSTIILSAGLFLLINGFLQVTETGWLNWFTWWQFILSVVLLGGFIWVQRVRVHPLLELAIFSKRQYLAGILSNTLGGILLMGSMIISPLFLTRIMQFSTLKASLMITPLSVSLLLIAPFIGKMIDKRGSLIPLILGYTITISSFGLLGTLDLKSSIALFMICMAFAGMGIGMIAVASLTLSTYSIPEDQLSIASGTFAMFRNLGGAIGIALFVSISMGRTSTPVGTQPSYAVVGFQNAYLSGAVLAAVFMCSLFLLRRKNDRK
ncbi:MFS transporter [Paenibacillus alba]|uniref:MFS transporter n=1 Tax=Paenibacillus alba TaxID=1197127 RepID=A0ABU6G9Z8_9BACL|nr:MFS transporter [Paenibacillus alba]MEC0231022.1 MFS transporter [Paenibacillus alba]